ERKEIRKAYDGLVKKLKEYVLGASMTNRDICLAIVLFSLLVCVDNEIDSSKANEIIESIAGRLPEGWKRDLMKVARNVVGNEVLIYDVDKRKVFDQHFG